MKTLATFVFATAICLFLALVPAKKPGADPVDISKTDNWIYRVTTDPTGERFVEVKWAIQSPDDIAVIRMPWGYRSFLLGPSVGAQLISNTHVETRQLGYAIVLAFSAILPDVKPHPPTTTAPLYEVNGQGLLYNAINKKNPVWDERRAFSVPLESIKHSLYQPPKGFQTALVRKAPRFGLKRIGPEKFVVEEWRKTSNRYRAPIYSDMWFDGETPEDSRSVIVCGSDEFSDGTPDPENGPNRVCSHYFTVEKLHARVKLFYAKKHLKEWQNIQTRVDALLSSFVTN